MARRLLLMGSCSCSCSRSLAFLARNSVVVVVVVDSGVQGSPAEPAAAAFLARGGVGVRERDTKGKERKCVFFFFFRVFARARVFVCFLQLETRDH